MPNQWTPVAITTIVCDLIVFACFLLMPYALRALFMSKRIGYVLNGWFIAISGVFVTCAIYRLFDAAVYFNPNVEFVQAMMNILTAAASAIATAFLFWREQQVIKHPEMMVDRLTDALNASREYLNQRGLPDEPDQETEQRTA